MSLLDKIYLMCWKGKKTAGPNKEVRISRSYDFIGKGVLDINWCLRDNRSIPQAERCSTSVISERANIGDAKGLIRRIESQTLPKAIEEYIQRMKKSSKG